MTYEQLLEQIIVDGIEAANFDYQKPGQTSHRKGAVEGFQACRGKRPDELVELWKTAENNAVEHAGKSIEQYWYWRCYALEVEWTCNVISVGLTEAGLPPLLAHLPTARAAMKYAKIVGVRGAVSA